MSNFESKFGISPMQWLRKWHRAAGVKSRAELNEDERKEYLELRMRLIEEEYEELMDELFLALQPHGMANIYDVAKEMADLLVVIYGTAEGLDIPLESVFDEVMLSNWSKVSNGIARREDGKILKGDHYFPPDIEKVFNTSSEF